MLTIVALLIALAIIVTALCVVHILGCFGRLIFWICGIVGLTCFLLLLF